MLENGDISYSDRFLLDSEATHTCDVGYVLQLNGNDAGTSGVRTCSMTGWSGSNFECNRKFC